MDTGEKAAFRKTVRTYYKKHGRALPWRSSSTRKIHNAYRILVSEIMLQQTQVDRVSPKYRAFLKQFPNVVTLAAASQGDVLRMWQGLGYNRRAKMLHQCAQRVVAEYGGRIPADYQSLTQLPGIGPYTANALLAFAYNQPVVMIETNIRTVYLHHFFTDRQSVSDTELTDYIDKTLDVRSPREWYWALMDYGAMLKKTVGNKNTQSKHYTKQAAFADSNRQIRGAIIRLLAHDTSCTESCVYTKLPHAQKRITAQLERLSAEGLIVFQRRRWRLAE